MPLILERFEEFRERHSSGGEPILIRDRWLFPDAAQSDGNFSHTEPPEDDDSMEWLGLRLEYLQARYEQAVAAYNQLRTSINTQANWHLRGSAPSVEQVFGPDWRSELKKAFREAEKLALEVESVREQIFHKSPAQQHCEAVRDAEKAEATSIIRELMSYPSF